MIDLTGKVALVSGGSGGLGLAHAEVFAELGASVVIGDVHDGPGRELAGKLAPQVTHRHQGRQPHDHPHRPARSRPRGVRVVCIHPGAVDTPMMHNDGNRLLEPAGVPEDQRDIDALLRQAVPSGRVADRREIARWSAFPASAPSDYATGSEYVLDGGLIVGSASI